MSFSYICIPLSVTRPSAKTDAEGVENPQSATSVTSSSFMMIEDRQNGDRGEVVTLQSNPHSCGGRAAPLRRSVAAKPW